MEHSRHKLLWIASGQSPISMYTKRLSIFDLVPHKLRAQQSPETIDSLRGMIASVIQAFKMLEEVQYVDYLVHDDIH